MPSKSKRQTCRRRRAQVSSAKAGSDNPNAMFSSQEQDCLVPSITPVGPFFRNLIPHKVSYLNPPVQPYLRRYLHDPEFLPAYCIRLGKHRAAPVLELPVVLTDQPVPSHDEHPCLYYIDNEVFVKHWNFAQFFNPCKPYIGEQDSYRSLSTNNVESFIETRPHDDSLLTIAVVTGRSFALSASLISTAAQTFKFSTAEIRFVGVNVPLSIYVLVTHGVLSLHYISDRKSLQFVFHDVPFATSISKSVSNFLSWLRNVKGGNLLSPISFFDRDWVYESVRRTSTDTDSQTWSTFMKRVEGVDALHVNLRSYQRRAVAWMLFRELGDPQPLFDLETFAWPETLTLAGHFAISRPNVQLVNKFSFCSQTLTICFDSDVAELSESIKIGPGGFLCDEMGLGKTVELMQLVLCNRSSTKGMPIISPTTDLTRCVECKTVKGSLRVLSCAECCGPVHMACRPCVIHSSKPFLCSRCARRMAKLCHESASAKSLPESRATLVVVPPSLLLQWQGELEKHVKDSLKIVSFLGLKRSGYIPQRELIDSDVVLTTYDALRSDVRTVEALRRPRSNLRREKQYYPIPVPLLLIRWHRLALDESQMLGASANAFTLKMARYIHARFRWCVTGTPVGDNLRGSLAMLSVLRNTNSGNIPWDELWTPTIYQENRKRVSSLLRSIMWRTMKVDVEGGELSLPPQIVEVYRVQFGPIERYYYQSLLSEIVAFRALRSRQNSSIAQHSRDILTTLRQACCHPQVGAAGRRLLTSHPRSRGAARYQNSPQQMSECPERDVDMVGVLSSLLSKCHVECQDSLRTCIASMNGLAGIRLLEASISFCDLDKFYKVASAIRQYREGLSLAFNMSRLVKVDNVQRMHILFNLDDALSIASSLKDRIFACPNSSSKYKKLLDGLPNIVRTESERSLLQEFEILRQSYIREAETKLKVVTAELHRQTELLGKTLGKTLFLDSATNDDDRGASSSEANTESQGRSTFRPLLWWERALSIILEESNRKKSLERDAEKEKGRNESPNKISMFDAELFLQDVREELEANRKKTNCITSYLRGKLSSFIVLPNVIETEINSLLGARTVLLSRLKSLPGGRPPSKDEVAESGQCNECRESMQGPSCAHCLAEELIQNVETKLYTVSGMPTLENPFRIDFSTAPYSRPSRTSVVRMVLNGGLPSQSRVRFGNGIRTTGEIEILLNKLLRTAMKISRDPTLRQGYSQWMEQFRKLKDELASVKVVVEAQRNLLGSMDEVSMVQSRLTLLRNSVSFSSLSESEKRYHVRGKDVPVLACRFDSEVRTALKQVQEKRGRYSYLRSLKSSLDAASTGKRGRDNEDEICAICYLSFVEVGRLAVFKCGHLFCGDCAKHIVKAGQRRSDECVKLSCPSCRQVCESAEILFTAVLPSENIKRKRSDVASGSTNDSPSDAEGRVSGSRNNLETSISVVAASAIAGPSSAVAQDSVPETNGISETIIAEDVNPLTANPTSVIPSGYRASNLQTVGRNESLEIDGVGDENLSMLNPTNVLPSPASVNGFQPQRLRRRTELSTTFADNECNVKGRCGCKLSALVRLLSGIWKKDSKAKVVVFSEWEEVLDVALKVLAINALPFFDGSSRSKRSSAFSAIVEDFKHHSGGASLLLPLKKAGAGLNLTEATHVILVEPSMDIRLEKQAIGRIHRIGQTNVTYVHHLIVENTVEEQVLRRGDRWRQRVDDLPGNVAGDEETVLSPEQLVNIVIDEQNFGSTESSMDVEMDVANDRTDESEVPASNST